jgi:acyl-CoA thioester hydrolase
MSKHPLSLDELKALRGPFVCKIMQIEPHWIDHNGHLNMAYYNVIMDESVGDLFRAIGLGSNYKKERNCSTMTAECHSRSKNGVASLAYVRYLREVSLGDPLQVSIHVIAADEKRIHFFEELRHATEGWLSATSENISLHIDMSVRKVAPFPPDIAERLRAVVDAHARVPRPDAIGRSIAIPARTEAA